mgnify:CR=1 FL=1
MQLPGKIVHLVLFPQLFQEYLKGFGVLFEEAEEIAIDDALMDVDETGPDGSRAKDVANDTSAPAESMKAN